MSGRGRGYKRENEALQHLRTSSVGVVVQRVWSLFAAVLLIKKVPICRYFLPVAVACVGGRLHHDRAVERRSRMHFPSGDEMGNTSNGPEENKLIKQLLMHHLVTHWLCRTKHCCGDEELGESISVRPTQKAVQYYVWLEGARAILPHPKCFLSG